MDGPHVNKNFAKQLSEELGKVSTSFMSIGTCRLHIVNNAFGEGMKALAKVINLDQFAIVLHFFFKYSAARREDLNKVSSITNVTIEYVL